MQPQASVSTVSSQIPIASGVAQQPTNTQTSFTNSLTPIIQIKDVSKFIAGKQILKNITLDIYPNEILGIIGASGAGKTTLLRALVGFFNIDAGKIMYHGMDISHNVNAIRKMMGFASQDSCFYEELTCIENLEYFGQLYKLPRKEIMTRSEQLLKLVELWDKKSLEGKHLSGGQRKRLDLACALIHTPKILIMDEPTTGLDPLLRKHMWDLINHINGLGTTILISSHILEDIEHLCSRVAMISKGRLLVAATPDQLKTLYSRNLEVHLETYPGRYDRIIQEMKRRRLPISMFANQEHKLILYTPNAELILHHIIDINTRLHERLLDLDINKPSLGEVFEAFVQYYNEH